MVSKASTLTAERRERFLNSIKTTVPYDPFTQQTLGGQTFAGLWRSINDDILTKSWKSAMATIESALYMQRLDGFQKIKLRMLKAAILVDQPRSKYRKAIRLIDGIIAELELEFKLNEKMPDAKIAEITVEVLVAALHLRLEHLPKSAPLRRKYRLARKLEPGLIAAKQLGTGHFDLKTLDRFNALSTWSEDVITEHHKGRNYRS